MNANKTNQVKIINWVLFPFFLIGMTALVTNYINSKPKPGQTETPTTPAIDSVTIDKLKACLKLTTTIPVQEHDIIVIPFVGETVGFTSMHSPACKHKSHK